MQSNPRSTPAGQADRISGIVLAAVGVFLLHEAWRLPFGTLSAPEAGFFPRSLAALLIVGGVTLFLRSLRSGSEPLDFTRAAWRVVVAIALLFAYGLLLERVGFLICTIAILFLLMQAYGGLGWKLSLLIVVPSVVVTYLGFVQLGVPLPTGVLGIF